MVLQYSDGQRPAGELSERSAYALHLRASSSSASYLSRKYAYASSLQRNSSSRTFCCCLSSGEGASSMSERSTSWQYCPNRKRTASPNPIPFSSLTRVMTSPPLPHPKHLNLLRAVSRTSEGVFSSWKTQRHFFRAGPAFNRLVPGHRSSKTRQMSILDLTISIYLSFTILKNE